MTRLTSALALCLVAGAGFALAGCAIGNATRTASLTLPVTRTPSTVTETNVLTTTNTMTETRAHVVATTVSTTVTAVTTAPANTVVITVAQAPQPTTTTASDTHSTAAWGWIVAAILGIGLIAMIVAWFMRGRRKES